ncbi:MAG TPA: dienelactone hydrolase family protein [Candidatus Eremiobacteraceae bacterium]|nr:dienelactone hydrolase family protein [Candidatus Eremiobacteraceae bacterium]
MSRSAFVGISSAALAAGSAIARALAADSTLGAPHPPIVPEDDTAIQVLRPSLVRPGGDIGAYAAMPAAGAAGTPGVVVVQHVWGVDAQIRDVVRRFAKSGYVAIAPELYGRRHPPSGDGSTDYAIFSPFAQALVDDQVDGDLRAGADWIASRPGHDASSPKASIGLIGFCMGGSIALRNAVDSPQFKAASVFYGKIRQNASAGGAATEMSLAYAREIKMPLCGSYGARDTGIPAADVSALRERLSVPNDLKVYGEAGHAFFDDTRPSYVASAAADAWSRTL